MVEIGLVAFLLSKAPIVAIVGQRIEPMRTTQGVTYPRLTYQRVSTDRVRTNDGPTLLAQARIQLDCWAEGPAGYDTAKQLADEVRKAVDCFKGEMGSVTVQGAFLDDDEDISEAPGVDDRSVSRVSMDLTVWFGESAA